MAKRHRAQSGGWDPWRQRRLALNELLVKSYLLGGRNSNHKERRERKKRNNWQMILVHGAHSIFFMLSVLFAVNHS
jgi:hypothetical protein